MMLNGYLLRNHLERVPYKDVRGMATRLGLRLRQQQNKEAWIDRIVSEWSHPQQQLRWLGMLSSSAHRALTRLLAAEQIPAALFWAEYGTVRQVTAQQQWTPPPWQAPTTVSEELYDSGLLCPTPHPPPAHALPALAPLPGRRQRLPAPGSQASPPALVAAFRGGAALRTARVRSGDHLSADQK